MLPKYATSPTTHTFHAVALVTSTLTSPLPHRLVESFQEYKARAVSVSCGEKHTLILTDDGEVLSCGVGEYGRLGTGSTSDCTAPLTLESLLDYDIVQAVAGASHSLALTREGQVYAWGRNDMGQLGAGDSFMDIYSMEDFPRLIDSESLQGKVIVSVAAGKGRSAAVSRDGELFLWGNKLHHEPLQVELPDNCKVRKVVCGGSSGRHCIAIITQDGALWTMGEGSSCMVGRLNVSTKNPTFERVPGLLEKQVLDVSVGFGNHILALVREDAP
jgi:alpha-tubulin suppressor-like RCC1 family protein